MAPKKVAQKTLFISSVAEVIIMVIEHQFIPECFLNFVNVERAGNIWTKYLVQLVGKNFLF